MPGWLVGCPTWDTLKGIALKNTLRTGQASKLGLFSMPWIGPQKSPSSFENWAQIFVVRALVITKQATSDARHLSPKGRKKIKWIHCMSCLGHLKKRAGDWLALTMAIWNTYMAWLFVSFSSKHKSGHTGLVYGGSSVFPIDRPGCTR